MPKPPVRRPLRHRRPRGVSMLETMVACLVLSAGLAVIGAMQTRAVFNSSNAALQATMAQTLWSYNEARLVNLNDFRSGGASACNGTTTSTRQTDLTYFNTFLNTNANCTGTPLTEFQADSTSTVCFKPIAQTRAATCTLRNDSSPTVLRTPVWTP